MSFNFDIMPDRRFTDSVKWRHYDPDVLPMWVADMDFYTPDVVLQALHKRIEEGSFGYGITLPGLLETICERLDSLYHWKITPDAIHLVPGVIHGFNLAVHALTAPGEGILINTPVYPPIYKSADVTHRTRQAFGFARFASGRYEFDPAAMRSAVDSRSRIFLLCNPHNPVGRVFRRDELEAMAEICLERDLFICSDEIHADLVYSSHHHLPIASLSPELAQRTITLMAPSKTFNIPGLYCSFLVCQNPNIRARLDAAKQGLLGSVNVLGQVAALAVYTGAGPWLDALLVYLEANRDYLIDFVHKHLPGVTITQPEGTYLAWLDFSALHLPQKPCDYFVTHARVAMNDGLEFGPEGDSFVRLNFGCPRAMLTEALEKIAGALP